MVSDRLKTVIYNKLYNDLSHVEIIPHKNELWFIDRENKSWYFIYSSDGTLWWKYGFFNTFFGLFTLTDKEFTPILSSWVEGVLNCRIKRASDYCSVNTKQMEEVLNCKVNTTAITDYVDVYEVEEVLNCKVNTTKRRTIPTKVQVKEFFYCKVNTTTASARLKSSLMEEIINHNVDNNCGSDLSYISEVNEVLNNTDI
jgi:hypothetical protein